MCSIAGIIHLKKDAEERPGSDAAALERMMRALHHRGPDDCGLWFAPDVLNATVGLANTRLAILDLSPAGHQPMLDHATGRALTYNGEVYNFLDLRGQLSETVGEWQSHTDTEVVLKAYEQWGISGLERLRGMFALALWDAPAGKLLLARDPLGIKPLYYYQTDELFVFASEIRALLASNLVPRQLSRDGLTSYLERGSVEAPATIIEGVRSLLPGHYLSVTPREHALHVEGASYAGELGAGQLFAMPSKRDDAVRQLREILEDSVRRHLISDVPLGVFLSGGIDSSALVALMSRVAGERVKSFSVVFAEEKFSEASHARLIADKFGTEHREIPLGEDGLLALLPDALNAIDQPTMDGINTFVVSKSVKQAGITVALSGLGGDELFAGYNTFHRGRQLQTLARVPRPLRRAAASLGQSVMGNSVGRKKFWELMASDGSPRAAYDVTRQLFASDDIRSLLNNAAPHIPALNGRDDGHDTINAVSRCELEGYMVNTLLRDTDFMSMAHSLEVRVPFVDAVVVDFVLNLPGAWKVNGGRAKPLLQDALGPLLPAEITQRPKMGFTLPFENWMQSRLRDDLSGVFTDERRFEAIGIRPQRVQETWRRFLDHPRRVGWSRPWALYVLAKWCELHGVAI
jgi:asparagine synthase (glutamine-hydrolysing)